MQLLPFTSAYTNQKEVKDLLGIDLTFWVNHNASVISRKMDAS